MLIDRLRQIFASAALMLAEAPNPPDPASPTPVEVPRPSDEVALRHLHTRRAGLLKLIANLKEQISDRDVKLINARRELSEVEWSIDDLVNDRVTPR